jgi:hypothetical protein
MTSFMNIAFVLILMNHDLIYGHDHLYLWPMTLIYLCSLLITLLNLWSARVIRGGSMVYCYLYFNFALSVHQHSLRSIFQVNL